MYHLFDIPLQTPKFTFAIFTTESGEDSCCSVGDLVWFVLVVAVGDAWVYMLIQ